MACRSLLTLTPTLHNASLRSPPKPQSSAAAAAAASFLSPPRRALGLALAPGSSGRKRAMVAAAARRGPSTNSLLLAFFLPLSLLLGTVFASLRIADRLDQQYLEELAMNEAIMEEKEAEEGDDGDEVEEVGDGTGSPAKEEAVAAPGARNLPRRQV